MLMARDSDGMVTAAMSRGEAMIEAHRPGGSLRSTQTPSDMTVQLGALCRCPRCRSRALVDNYDLDSDERAVSCLACGWCADTGTVVTQRTMRQKGAAMRSTLKTETETIHANGTHTAFELVLFSKSTRRTRFGRQPQLTIGRTGSAYLNVAADAALGQPPAVLLLTDEARGVLALRPTSADDPNGFSLGTRRRPATCRLALAAWLSYYGIPRDTLRQYPGCLCGHDLIFEFGHALRPAR